MGVVYAQYIHMASHNGEATKEDQAMYGFALMSYDPNGTGSDIVSQHKAEEAAYRALSKLGNVRGYYVAKRKPCGEFEAVLEAMDRREGIAA